MASEDLSCPSSLPPVTTHDYQPQGKWQKIAGVDVYVVEPPQSSTRAILAVYDIFGVVPQTVQGCDRVAAEAGAWVFMPDFFEGDPVPLERYPVDTDEKKKAMADWRARRGGHDAAAEKFQAVIAAVKKDKEEWKALSWGAYGLCWGGKLVILHSGKDTLFKAGGAAHPGRPEVEDAKALTIPHICLLSGEDGSPEFRQEYTDAIKAAGDGNFVETYGDMVHGWLSGRSNLEDPKVVKEFEKGYSQLSNFFKKHV